MSEKEIVIIADYSQDTPLTLAELCEICDIPSDFIYHLIEYEIIHPRGSAPNEWVFELAELKRIKTVLRLQRDLEINLAGAAVVLDLLDQLKALDEEVELIEKHYISHHKITR